MNNLSISLNSLFLERKGIKSHLNKQQSIKILFFT